MSTPIISISSASTENGGSSTDLQEGANGQIAITVKSSEVMSTTQQVLVSVTGSATSNYGPYPGQSGTINSLGEGLFAKFQMPDNTSISGIASVGNGASGAVYVVLQKYTMPSDYSTSTSRDFIVQKYSADGTLDTSFDGDGSKLFSFSSNSGSERFVFAENGSFAVQSGSSGSSGSASIQVFSASGVLGQTIALDSSGNARLLGMSADQLFVQNTSGSSTDDMHVFSTSTGGAIGSFSSASSGYGSAYFSSYNTVASANESFAVTADGKFVWSDSSGVHAVNAQLDRTDFPTALTSGLQSGGKFYSYSPAADGLGKLSVYDTSTQNATEYSINLGGKATSANLVGVADDGSILLSSSSLSVAGLPSGLNGLFKLNLTSMSGSQQYQLDNTFGEQGMVLSAQSTSTYDVKAVVGDSFLSYSNMSSGVPDLNIWSNNSSLSMTTLSDGTKGFYVTIPVNSSEATFYVNANTDFIAESLESLQFSIRPMTSGTTNPSGTSAEYSVSDSSSGINVFVKDAPLAMGIDLTGSDSQGIRDIETGPNDYYLTSTTPPSYSGYALNQPKLWDALLNSSNDLSQLKISVKPGEFIDSTHSVSFDFKFGYDNSMYANGMYASTTIVQGGNFKIKLGEADSLDKDYYFTQYVDGSNHLFSIRQSFVQDSQSYEFTISTEDGMALSPEAASNLLRNIGIAYSDPTTSQSTQHHISFDVQVSALDVLGQPVAATSLDSDKAVFEFTNLEPEIFDASFSGKFIQLLFHSGPSSEVNFDVASADDSYNSWRGQPDKNLFTVKVNGTVSTEYQIEEVIQDKSVLLVLNKELPANATVTVSYNDGSSTDLKQYVIQSWQGNDAQSFTNHVATYGHTINVTGQVLSGAELGWNAGAEESSYLDVDWNASSIAGKVISVSAGQAVVEFHTTGWHQNPNFDNTKSTGLQSDPYAELVLQATLSKAGWTPMVDDSLSFSQALGYDQGYNISSFKTILNTSNELSQAPSASSIESYELMVYNMPSGEGVPFSYLASSNFNFANMSVNGSAFNDVLGDPTSIGDLQINAGDGDDHLIGGYGDDRLNGGRGLDTLHVAGLQKDFDIQKTGANTFTLTPKNLASWDSGGVDKLVSIEKVQFDDATIQLASVDPQSNTTVTALATSTTTLIQPNGEGFDYLDLTALSVSASGIPTSFQLEAGFYQDSGLVWVPSTGQSWDFSGFEGYIVSGNSNKISTFDDQNDVVLVKSGADHEIVLGTEDGTDLQDVLSFRGTNSGVSIDLDPLDGSGGFVTFTTNDGSSRVQGADIVFGSDAADTINGFASKSNLLAGYAGDDFLKGGAQSDVLFGGVNNDTLDGGAGNDVLIDLDQASLTGGEGKDQFVVRGSTASEVAQIKDLELSPEGLTRGGVNSQNFTDRIIFNFSTAAFANSSLSALVSGASGSLSTADYLRLRQAIELKVVAADGGSSKTNFVVSAYLREAMSENDSTAGLLGRVEFVTASGQSLSETESIRAVKLAQSMDFLQQASVPTDIMDQMLTVDTPLSTTASSNTDSVQVFSETVSLVFGLEKTDIYTVSPEPGQHPPILIPVVVNGIEYATRFQLGNADEKVVGSRSDDVYEFITSSFIDADGNLEANQTFGNDVIVERGNAVDAVRTASSSDAGAEQAAVSVDFVNTGRDVIALANENTQTGVSIHDLLVGDLDLVRMQKGREGTENSLKVTYQDSTSVDVSALNDVNVTVYKQYYAADASFRVEDIQLLDLGGHATRYDLGQSFKDATSQGLVTYDARDAILLARTNAADTFKLMNTTTGEPDHEFNVFLKDFDFVNDTIEIEGYGTNFTSSVTAPDGNGDSKLTLTLSNAASGPQNDYTVNLYFMDTTLPDDELQWLKAV